MIHSDRLHRSKPCTPRLLASAGNGLDLLSATPNKCSSRSRCRRSGASTRESPTTLRPRLPGWRKCTVRLRRGQLPPLQTLANPNRTSCSSTQPWLRTTALRQQTSKAMAVFPSLRQQGSLQPKRSSEGARRVLQIQRAAASRWQRRAAFGWSRSRRL